MKDGKGQLAERIAHAKAREPERPFGLLERRLVQRLENSMDPQHHGL